MENIYDSFKHLTAEEWCSLLKKSVRVGTIDSHQFPGFPDNEFQKKTVGSSEEQALIIPGHFYKYSLKHFNNRSLVRHDELPSVLDFGCAWGRITRHFLHFTKPQNIWGVDVNKDSIEMVRDLFHGHCNFLSCDLFPPVDLADDQFDLITGFSVMSHLSQEPAKAWFDELIRLLKPGGTLVLTTRARRFIMFSHQQLLGDEPETAQSRDAVQESLQAYDNGEFIFRKYSGGGFAPIDYYGEAIVPEQWWKEQQREDLRMVDFNDSEEFGMQSVVCYQKTT